MHITHMCRHGTRMHAPSYRRMQYMHEGSRVYPYVKLRRSGLCTKHASRPQVEANHAGRDRGRPEAEDMHARKCPMPEASHVLCMHVLCKDGPAKA
eukprot:40845-Chlamydomonas_euryale.AAC.8